MNNPTTPIDAVIAITYKCNSRCTMCDIWKIKEHNDLNLEYYKNLPASLKYINISGGEPFLREDFTEVVKTIAEQCPKAEIIISSNGFAAGLIVEKMKELKKIIPARLGIGLSLDGIGEMHDQIRGINGAFEKVLQTANALKQIGITNIRFGFTINDQNISHINKVYDLAKKMNVQFTLTAAQSSEIFFGGKQNVLNLNAELLEKEIKILQKKYFKGFNIKNWLRAYFAQGVYDFSVNKKMNLPSVSGSLHFFLDPYGKIYPSVVHHYEMGDITKKSFKEIWESRESDEIRKKIKESGQQVWMVCTARTAIRQNPLKVAWWILRNKFFIL